MHPLHGILNLLHITANYNTKLFLGDTKVASVAEAEFMTQCLHANSSNSLLLTSKLQKVKIQNPDQIFKDIVWPCLESFRLLSDHFWEAAGTMNI